MKLHAMLVLAMLAGAWSGTATSAPTPMLECNACTPLQEENKIRNGNRNGWFLVYNLANARIRKFNTYLIADDSRSTGGGGSIGSAGLESDEAALPEAGDLLDTTPPGWMRALEEYPVDEGVRRIFNLLLKTEREQPGVNFGRSALSIPISSLGQTPGSIGVRDFDPREIAWSREMMDRSEYQEFLKRLQERMSSREGIDRISPLLGEVLQVKAEIKSASVSIGTSGASVGIDIANVPVEQEIKFCDKNFNCVVLKIANNGHAIKITFVKVEDRDGTSLPAKSRNINVDFGQGGRDTSSAYIDWLRRKQISTEVLGGSSGCSYILACVAVNDAGLLACKLYCQ